MNRKQKRFLLLALILILLVQIACETDTIFSAIDRFNCEAKGGTWRQEVINGIGLEEWCEMQPTQAPGTGGVNDATPTATKAIVDAACVGQGLAYDWSYQDYSKSSGTGGVTCNARFLFRNASNEPLYLVIYTAWDNNAMQDRGWETYQVQPAGEWEFRVSRTNYTDGVVTYSRVEKFLVVRDAPECAGILSTENQPIWEAQATSIEAISCP